MMPTYTTPIFITETLHIVTYVHYFTGSYS